MESDKFNIAKSIFKNIINPINLTYYTNNMQVTKSNYKSKPPEQTIKDGFGFCTEQIEVAETMLRRANIQSIEKYQLFAVPKNNIYEIKIDLSHAFIGIPDEKSWILFETGFRTRNRGGVRKFNTQIDGLNYILKLYDQSLQVANIKDMLYTIYRYDFSPTGMTFQNFANKIISEKHQVFFDRQS